MSITLTARPGSGIRSGQRRSWMGSAVAPVATRRLKWAARPVKPVATVHALVSRDDGLGRAMVLVDFRVTGETVRITTTDTSWDKQIVRVSITAARVEYRRLLKAGYRTGSACMSR